MPNLRIALLVVVGLARLALAVNVFQGNCGTDKVVCEQLCITLTPDTYECSCWEGHQLQDDGLSCKVDTVVEYEKKRVIPTRRRQSSLKAFPDKPLAFKGNNYAEFPIRDNAYLETNVTIQFRLEEQRDGILLFAGQLAGDDFLSITIDGPNVIMRHDCGEGTIEDMYHGTFRIGDWHEITVWRKNCDRTQMRVDRGRRLVDMAEEFKNFKGITMDEGVFVGGAPRNIDNLRQKTGVDDGFRGCIRYLVVNDEVLLDANRSINHAFDSSSLLYCEKDEPPAFATYNESVHQIKMFDLTQRGLPMISETPKGLVPPCAEPTWSA
ncbi:unnamed protein product [Caenorhabditis bovis]|uniref:Laminin G domain-containing protein n=1 Tax=Caenorhabditis bovis TaxID=2654633 RepID=A0A8S1EVQ5_9PELO|nr:unnamed protein product [Caenorhabditis bovis]